MGLGEHGLLGSPGSGWQLAPSIAGPRGADRLRVWLLSPQVPSWMRTGTSELGWCLRLSPGAQAVATVLASWLDPLSLRILGGIMAQPKSVTDVPFPGAPCHQLLLKSHRML